MAIDYNNLPWKEYIDGTRDTGYRDGYIVYRHTNKYNGRVYVGITVHVDNPNRRWSYGRGYIKSQKFFNAIVKYGWDSFKHEIVLVDSYYTACELERALVLYYKSLNMSYNICNGGTGPGAMSEESKEKLRSYTPWIKGRHHTKESRKKISDAGKGRKMKEEHRLRLIEINKRRPHIVSDKQRRKSKEIFSKPVLQIDKKTGEVIAEYQSAIAAELALRGRKCGHVSEVCLGRPNRQTYCGYKWRYK